MFVWNTFQNDARVLKEAQTLVRDGNLVTIFALMAVGETPVYEIIEPGLDVRRVHRSSVTRLLRKIRPARPVCSNIETTLDGAFVDRPQKRGRIAQALQLLSRVSVHLGLIYHLVKMQPDVIHSHDVNTLPTCWLASKISRSLLVYDAHEISTDREGYRAYRGLIASIEKLIIPVADATITTTETRAKFFARAYRVPRPIVLQNRPRFKLVEHSDFLRRRLQLNEEAPIVLYQGGLQPGRGLEDLVRVAKNLPVCHIVFVGGGRLCNHLQKMTQDLDLTEKVHFIPTVSLELLPTLTASADIGVQPLRNTCLNHFSTDSNKLFEYAMAGLPIVASDFPEIRRVINTHNIGKVFDPEKSGALFSTLEEIILDKELRAELSKNALGAAKKLSWEQQEMLLVNTYRNIGQQV